MLDCFIAALGLCRLVIIYSSLDLSYCRKVLLGFWPVLLGLIVLLYQFDLLIDQLFMK